MFKSNHQNDHGRLADCFFTSLLLAGLCTFMPGRVAYGAENHVSANSQTQAHVWGLQVVKPPLGKGNDTIKPNSWYNFKQHGSTMLIGVKHPAGGLLKINEKASKISSFVDDQGTNLLEGDFQFKDPGEPQNVRFTKDQTAALVEVRGPTLPAGDASSMHLKGTLVFRAASKTKVFTQKSVALKKGTKITAGPIKFTVNNVQDASFGDWKMKLSLECDQRVEVLKSIEFHGPQGKVIESRRSGRSMSAFGDQVHATLSFYLKKKIARAKSIELTYWQDVHDVKVPLDLSATLGLK